MASNYIPTPTGPVIVSTDNSPGAVPSRDANGDLDGTAVTGVIGADVSGTTAATFTVDSASSAAKIKLDTNSATGNFTSKWVTPNIAGNVTITFPAVTSTLATLAGTEALTNKTLTSPVIGTGLTASGSAANTFAGSTGTFITSTGLNTLSGLVAFKVIATPVAAAGSTVSDAGQLGSATIVVNSSASASAGVKLQTGVAGQIVFVINSSATACELYAASGGTVNGLSADASVVLPASKGVLCLCTAADTWTVYDLPAKATAS